MTRSSRRSPAFVFSLILTSAPAVSLHAATHTVNQSGLTFSPTPLTITEGDSVRWVWSAGSHTVTNGTGAADPQAGTLFDSPLNTTNKVVTYEFTTAGTYPYFCRPHEGFGMKGTIVVDLATDARAPLASLSLAQNYPNPFDSGTDIEFSLSATAPVRLDIYDARGTLVATLEDGRRSEGPHRTTWDGRDSRGKPMPNGVYFYRLESGATVLTRKLVLIK